MQADSAWGGLWRATEPAALAADAARLYTDRRLWAACQASGQRLLATLYGADARLAAVRAAVEGALADLETRRGRDYVGAVLWQQGLRATEFFARWVELKEAQPVVQPAWQAPAGDPRSPPP